MKYREFNNSGTFIRVRKCVVNMKRRISTVIEIPGKIREIETNSTKCAGLNEAGVAEPIELINGATNPDLAMEWDEEWPDIEFDVREKYFTLDLSTWKRCKVLKVEQLENKYLKITLKEKRGQEKAVCHLLPPWNTIEGIAPGLTISVLATKEHVNSDHFVVTADCGFFVTDPDLLASGTTVVSSLFCQRRGVLQELFRISGLESTQMVIGTLVHCIFQRCLLEKVKSQKDLQTIAENVMKSRKIISSLYAVNMSIKQAFCLIDPYLKEIETFIKKHLHLRPIHKITPPTDCDKISICEINDIEENIWCHQLGMKGRIDATVSVACDSGTKRCETMPLELKTGRASYSFEHLGQLALYEMMMELVGHDVSAGLLVYLRDGKCSRVAANRNIKRDLIMLRNEVTRFLSTWMITNEVENNGCEEILPLKPTLPAPINNERACAKCPYSTVCVALSTREHEFRISDIPNGFAKIAETACEHLRNSDIDYFIRWTGLIYLEVKESALSQSARNFWNLTPKERSENGWCITGLTLLTPVHTMDDLYFHTFTLNQQPANGFDPDAEKENTVPQTIDTFQVGEYIVCSTTKRIAVASGHIISYAGNELVVSFERDLSANYSGERFILDQNASFKSSGFDLSNLAMLLNNDEAGARNRRIIIDREKATFSDGILCKSMIPKAKEILKQLNRHQKQAALKAAATETYCLLKGLPGTGKTQTIVGIIRLLSLLGQSVLLTSNTHSAVDNILKRLLPFKELSFIRLGPMDRIDPSVRSFAEPILAENCDSPEKMAELYGKFQIVAATCMGTGHALITQRVFDYCIVDEATQVFQTNIIRPLLRCKKFLLVGDPEQLPPVVKSVRARSLGAAESLFHRLNQEGSYCILPTQYRMNRVLTKLSNDFTYNGELICGNDVVANATLKLPNLLAVRRNYEVERWLMKTISNQIDLSAVIVNTGNTYQLNASYQPLNETTSSNNRDRLTKHMKCTNISEVALVVYICQALLQAGVKRESIGIIAPFRAQVDLLRSKIRKLDGRHLPGMEMSSSADMLGSEKEETENCACTIEVNTVDQYQGKDKKIIIFSCTKSVDLSSAAIDYDARTDSSAHEILNDKRRLTVAITRAKEKFIIIGDRETLDSYPTFKMLFNVASKVSHINLVDKKDGFEWSNAFELLGTLSE